MAEGDERRAIEDYKDALVPHTAAAVASAEVATLPTTTAALPLPAPPVVEHVPSPLPRVQKPDLTGPQTTPEGVIFATFETPGYIRENYSLQPLPPGMDAIARQAAASAAAVPAPDIYASFEIEGYETEKSGTRRAAVVPSPDPRIVHLPVARGFPAIYGPPAPLSIADQTAHQAALAELQEQQQRLAQAEQATAQMKKDLEEKMMLEQQAAAELQSRYLSNMRDVEAQAELWKTNEFHTLEQNMQLQAQRSREALESSSQAWLQQLRSEAAMVEQRQDESAQSIQHAQGFASQAQAQMQMVDSHVKMLREEHSTMLASAQATVAQKDYQNQQLHRTLTVSEQQRVNLQRDVGQMKACSSRRRSFKVKLQI